MALSLDIRKALCARAHARRQWPEMGFNDQSANLLAQLLGINLKQRLPLQDEQKIIERCQWFDERCLDFFQRHPRAMCIELGAGLSTRFHRLSDTADWPRFEWVDVDLPQVTSSKAKVLPAIDNYRLVSADIMNDNWLSQSGWVAGRPLLILMEAVSSEIGDDAILKLLYRLRQAASSAEELELVLDVRQSSRWQVWLKTIAVAFGAGFTLPITSSVSTLEYLDYHITRQKKLLGNTAVGLVINYKNQQELL